MKKTYFYVFSTILCLVSCRNQTSRNIAELDRVLANSEIYEEEFDKVSDSLRNCYSGAENDSLRWEVAYNLSKRFYIHNLDSCYRYVSLMQSYSSGDPIHEAVTSTCYARTLFRMDSLKRAFAVFTSIDTASVTDDFRDIYYSTGYRIYSNMPNEKQVFQKMARELADRWYELDSLNVESVYFHNRLHLHKNGKHDDAIANLQKCFRAGMSPNDSAKAYYCIATEFIKKGDEDNALPYLVKSAKTDCRISAKAYDALYQLSLMLFRSGDIRQADKYMRLTLEDAEKSNFNLRYKDVVRAEIDIMNTLLDQDRRKRRSLYTAMVSISLVLIIALISTILLIRYSQRLGMARIQLEEASKIKDGFLALYMEKCVFYLNKVDEYRSSLRRTAKNEGQDAAMAMLRKPSFAVEEFDDLLRSFDSTFLRIFPDFVDKVNTVMQPGHELKMPSDEVLSTELRILALIRLGISRRQRIAKVLNMSVSTVYSYHCNLQKYSLFPDSLDKVVSRL